MIWSHLYRATYSGFTPQYKGLEALYKKYKDRGFVILGFPCNQVRPISHLHPCPHSHSHCARMPI